MQLLSGSKIIAWKKNYLVTYRINYIDGLSDLERLIVSEGRTKNTSWFVCKPK